MSEIDDLRFDIETLGVLMEKLADEPRGDNCLLDAVAGVLADRHESLVELERFPAE